LIPCIAGDFYRFQNQFHFSVFLVTTPKGIIATDPINAVRSYNRRGQARA